MTDKVMVLMAALSPRGRCNRLGMLLVSQCVASIEIGLFFGFLAAGWTAQGAAVELLKLCCLWLSFASFSKRLHDLGHSAWWLIGGAASLTLWLVFLTGAFAILGGPGALNPGSPLTNAIVIPVVLPVVGVILWLHLSPGQTEENIFGPVPTVLGFSRA